MDRPWRSYSYGAGVSGPCCGSGKDRSVCKDALGNFVTYFCEDCEDQKLSGYNPDIWNRGYRYEDYDDEGLDW
jgi:hypothetical protein